MLLCVYTYLGWLVDASIMSGTQLILYKMGTSRSNTTLMVVFNLTVTYNFSWSLHYLGEAIDSSKCSLFKDTPILLNDALMIKNVLDKIDNSKVCVGNPDTKFDALIEIRQGFFKDQSGAHKATLQCIYIYIYIYIYLYSYMFMYRIKSYSNH